MYQEERPWGRYEVLLDGPAYKVKRIAIQPGEQLSLQSHKYRDEYWTIVSGAGCFTLGSSENLLDMFECNVGDSMEIMRGELHTIKCTGVNELVFIEVQIGEYLGEDDIIRYSDKYGRAEIRK